MKRKLPSIEKIGVITGLFTSLALIAYFMVMKALNLAHILELRFFNVIIIAFGVCYGINNLKQKLHESEFYLKGLAEGIYITLIAVVSFALFISLYLTYFDQELLHHIAASTNVVNSVDGLTIFLVITMEGMASGLIITFAAMQYLKVEGTKTDLIGEEALEE